jgi:GNAT superfamily N-acetyltransferase
MTDLRSAGWSLAAAGRVDPRCTCWKIGFRLRAGRRRARGTPGQGVVMVKIRNADMARDLEVVRALWLEYLSWGNEELEARFGFRFPIEKALEDDLTSIAKFQPPGGRLLLAVEGEQAVGIACLRRMSPGIAEIKRMFVRPAQRGAGLGGALLDHLITEAKASGYQRIRLDSARFMETAHALYRSRGFADIDSYPESEIPDELKSYWIFMERELD